VPILYLIMVIVLKGLKLVEAVAGLEKQFWCASPACEYGTKEHGVPEVHPARRAEFS
jgi:hypothetical protein